MDIYFYFFWVNTKDKMMWPENEGMKIQSSLGDREAEYTVVHMKTTVVVNVTYSRLRLKSTSQCLSMKCRRHLLVIMEK